MNDIPAKSFREVHFSARDGLTLYARDYAAASGDPSRPPVVCLPGLTRNARDFHRFAEILSGRDPENPVRTARRVIAFDYRGRGRSARDPNPANYNLAVEADDVLAGLAVLDVHRASFVGTSRGALIVHLLAAMRPASIAGAVLNDAGPVIEGAGLAQIKSYLTRLPAPRDWDHARQGLRDAHGASFTTLSDEDWAEMADAIYVEKDGRIAGDYDPALVDQLKSMDFSTPLPTLWPQFDGLRNLPVLTIRGGNSQLLSAKTVEAMQARHGTMETFTAPGQGHAPILHLAELPRTIGDFLDRHRL